MEGVQSFFESSTIHGLTYISTTRKYVRLFWILVVLTGFAVAGYLINKSFETWAESPIKTTIETRPMSEIRFPKVTVCPPKNTYTDLNYKLMLAEKKTLNKVMRIDLYNYTEKIVNEHGYMDEIDKLHEEDRYYNWYHGYTRIERNSYYVTTSATSGVIKTQYFGEIFQQHLVERKALFNVNVYPPETVRNNKSVTLHFKLEKVSIQGLSIVQESFRADDYGWVDSRMSSVTFNFSPSSSAKDYINMMMTRNNIAEEYMNTMEMDNMPGFQLSWYYTDMESELLPDNKFYNNEENQLFIG